MAEPQPRKSTLEEIRARFDADVERFSQLETGQQATMDAALVLETVASVAAQPLRPGARMLDLGCGAGNFTLRIAGAAGERVAESHLLDLSRPMLERARERLLAAGHAEPHLYQTDLLSASFPEAHFDLIVAGAVLHHLRDDAQWETFFSRLGRWLRPGGHLYVWDMVWFDDPATQEIMWQRYAAYLDALGGDAYRQKVFAYIEREDTPRSLPYQIGLLQRSGFDRWEVLHRNSVFACYTAQRAGQERPGQSGIA